MKTFARVTAPVVLTLLISACFCPQHSVVPASSEINALQPVARTAANTVLADIGHGLKTPAQLKFQIKLNQFDGFSTKASTPGTAAKTSTDLNTIKFYLVASDTGTPPTALSGTGFSYNITATNRTNGYVDVTFTNVAANAAGKSYYVLAAGFSSATTTAANNITNLNAPIADGAEGKYYVSTTGGSPAGSVRVTPVTYALSDTSTLGVPLKLLDAVSPILESSVNISSGDEVSSEPTGSGS